MLQHVREAQELDLIFRGVDLLVTVLEVAFDDERAGVAVLARARVVGARVAAFRQHVWDVAVLGHDLLNESRQTGVNVVGDDTDGFGLAGLEGVVNVARHVLLQHGEDVALLLRVGGEDGLGAKQATFFRGIPVKFDAVGCGAVGDLCGGEEHAQRFQDGDCAGAVVVCAWSG